MNEGALDNIINFICNVFSFYGSCLLYSFQKIFIFNSTLYFLIYVEEINHGLLNLKYFCSSLKFTFLLYFSSFYLPLQAKWNLGVTYKLPSVSVNQFSLVRVLPVHDWLLLSVHSWFCEVHFPSHPYCGLINVQNNQMKYIPAWN